MPVPKRTVTKSKKDGVKKKTVTYKSKSGTATRTKNKAGKGSKGKTTTVSNKKGKVVATSSKTKGKVIGLVPRKSRGKTTEKSKTVNLGRGRTASTKTAKGPAYYGKGKERKITSGGSGDTSSRTNKDKFNRSGLGGKRKDTVRGTTKQSMSGTKVSGMRTSTKTGRGPVKRKR